MTNKAYKSDSRIEMICAEEASMLGMETRFYCLDTDCDAHMYVCNLDGLSSAYFRAKYSKYSHIKGCNSKEINSFNLSKENEQNFCFENALNAMFIPGLKSNQKKDNSHTGGKGNSTDNPLRTVSQIYLMCKSFSCKDFYNNIEIGSMLFDNRSSFMYPRGVFGLRIIESIIKEHFYDKNTLEIMVEAPRDSMKYEFRLKFLDVLLFNEVKNKIFKNKNKKLIVAGNWVSSGIYNVFTTDILSKKQIAMK